MKFGQVARLIFRKFYALRAPYFLSTDKRYAGYEISACSKLCAENIEPFGIKYNNAGQFNEYPKSRGDVIIGSDVWIGTDAMILSGVRIGNGAVIGARSVVAKDVAPYSVAAGNPLRHIRYRFDAETVTALEKIAWWDWPIEKIQEAWPLLLSPDITSFITTYMKETR